MNPRPRLLVTLHWISFCVLVAGVAAIYVRAAIESKTGRLGLLDLHRCAGLLVLTLVAARLWARWRSGARAAATAVPTAARRTAAGVHALLYVLLAAIPLIGLRLSGAMGSEVRLFGIALPAWGGEDEDAADLLGAWHERLAWGLGVLIVVHVGAALWHHFILKDDVLATMVPRRIGRFDPASTRAKVSANNNLITPGEGNASIE